MLEWRSDRSLRDIEAKPKKNLRIAISFKERG